MSLDKTIKDLKASFSKELSNCKVSSELEKFRIKYLGRNGQLALYLKNSINYQQLKNLNTEKRLTY